MQRTDRGPEEDLEAGQVSKTAQALLQWLWVNRNLVERPVAHDDSADDLVAGDWSKAARVEAVEPIVTHHEIAIGCQREGLAVAVARAICAIHICFIERRAVDKHGTIAKADRVARQPNHALDQRVALWLGQLEDNDL